MSERKVLNKYYPPDFDPSKIPRARQGKNRQFTVRLMAPCNMCCNTCGEYIYKGKKFNARKEDVENETYLGIRIYRFYIKCTRCLQEISFKTDPESTDYVIEAGATRNFMALKLAEEQAEREEKAEKEDEATNPMKVLEKRTQASRHEMAVLEALEELKELNQRQIKPNYDNLFDKFNAEKEQEAKTEEDEDEAFVRSIFGKDSTKVIKRIEDDDGSSDEEKPPAKRFQHFDTKFDSNMWKKDGNISSNSKADTSQSEKPNLDQPQKSNHMLSQKSMLSKLVKVAPKPIVQKIEDKTLSESTDCPVPDVKPKNEAVSLNRDSPGPSETKGLSLGLNLLGAYSSDSDSSNTS